MSLVPAKVFSRSTRNTPKIQADEVVETNRSCPKSVETLFPLLLCDRLPPMLNPEVLYSGLEKTCINPDSKLVLTGE